VNIRRIKQSNKLTTKTFSSKEIKQLYKYKKKWEEIKPPTRKQG